MPAFVSSPYLAEEQAASIATSNASPCSPFSAFFRLLLLLWQHHMLCQSGLGSGPVFVSFKSRVRVLPCRVSGFGRVSNLPKKEVHFGKKSESF